MSETAGSRRDLEHEAERAAPDVPGWEVSPSTCGRYLVATHPAHDWLLVQAKDAKAVVDGVRALTRLQEVTRAVLGPQAGTMLQDEHWPTTRRSLRRQDVPLTPHGPPGSPTHAAARQDDAQATPAPQQVTQAAPARDRLAQANEARAKGYAGQECPECGRWTMVRNGTCLKCLSCGGTTGCS
jgi:hypothetical protein